jgi:plasmid maintenance system antidote protein VapI
MRCVRDTRHPFGKLFGDGAGIWTRMQAAYDTWHAEREVNVTDIPTIRAA